MDADSPHKRTQRRPAYTYRNISKDNFARVIDTGVIVRI